jgi:GTP-binding protein HflX
LPFEPSYLEELKSLAESAGYEVVGKVEQVRAADSRYQIGSGKVEELRALVKETGAQKIIFDNDLKPVQSYNLAKATGVEVIDRFQLILEIFVKRASTTEAKLQIQLARAQYELAHAKEKVRLAKLGEQPGFMGLGAYEVDVYFESVKRQVHAIQRKLRKIKKKRELHRVRRFEAGFLTISLAGYTNAGKTSLFNALTGEKGTVGVGLFTTLSTTTRAINLSNKKVLLTDTVGFIDRLPITLIDAFHSTLEETIFSDLILLVLDISEPKDEVERKLTCCLDTLKEIGANQIPIVTALNKIDLVTNDLLQEKFETVKKLAPNPVPISALYSLNLELLEQELLKNLKNYTRASVVVPLNEESIKFISWLHERTDILKIEYKNEYAEIVFEAVPWFAEKACGKVQQLSGKVIEMH